MRRVVLCGLPAAVLGMLAGGAASTNAATPVGHAPVVVAAPITTSALVGPAPAVREWSDCLVSTVNAARATAGAPPLKLELRVSLAAFGHSLDQAAAQTMSHSDGARTDGGMRLQAAGYSWSTWGENVAAGQADCEAVTAAWLGSSTHRANILNPQFRDVGFGMAIGANGVPYWTMDLAAG